MSYEQTGSLDEWWALAAEAAGLFGSELRLAAGDAGRMALLLLVVPLLLKLTWLGSSLLVAWVAVAATGYPLAGFVAFPILQVLALLWIRKRIATYSRSMKLPTTRKHMLAIMGTSSDGTTPTTH